ncbi:DUF2235 domain-containing protein [Dyella koreensis]|uniref:DUF2235 domain-containing protein n=1 Tax=Dyella koreensis TaxID=311235 RepID=A0ABW8K7U0_9GAMM
MTNPKRIALFLDGTWNTVQNNTNVWRAKSLCVTSEDQISYYSQGVGTLFGQRFMGGAFGYGLDAEVINAYEWLVENYNPGDRIFIFGFSRGAYTARALNGLISECGLLIAGSPLSVDQLYARYRRREVTSIRKLVHAADANLTTEERWLKRYSRPVAIWFLGVWDTVGALGLPFGNIPFISRSQYNFLQTDLWINDDTAYHALAIDEHRRAFAPTLWTWPRAKDDKSATGAYAFPDTQRVEQRWFAGAHANVGGGYANDILAQRPLMWLMEKAKARGLVFRDMPADDSVEEGLINNSFREMAFGLYALFHLLIPFRRPIGQATLGNGKDVKFVVNETIDASVFARWRADKTYRPKNVVDWARKFNIDPGTITTTVRADDPSVAVDAITLTEPAAIQKADGTN